LLTVLAKVPADESAGRQTAQLSPCLLGLECDRLWSRICRKNRKPWLTALLSKRWPSTITVPWIGMTKAL
jgi:hypothetical protein